MVTILSLLNQSHKCYLCFKPKCLGVKHCCFWSNHFGMTFSGVRLRNGCNFHVPLFLKNIPVILNFLGSFSSSSWTGLALENILSLIQKTSSVLIADEGKWTYKPILGVVCGGWFWSETCIEYIIFLNSWHFIYKCCPACWYLYKQHKL